MSKGEEYRAKAADHFELAQTSQSDEVREIHRRIGESFLALADNEEWLHGERSPHVSQPVRLVG